MDGFVGMLRPVVHDEEAVYLVDPALRDHGLDACARLSWPLAALLDVRRVVAAADIARRAVLRGPVPEAGGPPR
jgi:hypothetical protein